MSVFFLGNCGWFWESFGGKVFGNQQQLVFQVFFHHFYLFVSNRLHLKMDGWKWEDCFPFRMAYFQMLCHVSFREGVSIYLDLIVCILRPCIVKFDEGKVREPICPRKKPHWLGYIGDYTTQLYRGYDKPL